MTIKLFVIFYLLYLLKVSNFQKVASEKCIEYSQIMRNKPCPMEINPLIVGGEAARDREFPHMVALAFLHKNKMTWKCGGTLISDRHILTAAHCCKSRYGLPKIARMGAVDLSRPTKFAQDRFILEATIHPNFSEAAKYNDLAVLFLNKPVEFSLAVRPACLNIDKQVGDKEAEVIGFGKQHRVADHHHNQNPPLQKAFISIIPNQVCNEYMIDTRELPEIITESMICAGILETGGKDACQGDSGGPLQVVLKDVYCMFKLIGVVSAGNHCAMAYDPGLYTNVAYFVKWIEDVVWPLEK